MLVDQCPHCGYDLERRTGDTWFFTYMTTAFITGLIVLAMLLFPPKNHALGLVLVVTAWFFGIVLTLPFRKSLALSFEYYFENRGKSL